MSNNLITIISIIIILTILFLAIRYIVMEKKKGAKCVGCPFADEGGCPKHGGCHDK